MMYVYPFFFLSTIFRRRPICIRSSLSIRYIRSDRVPVSESKPVALLSATVIYFFHFSKKGILHNGSIWLSCVGKQNAKVEYLLSLLHSTDYSVSSYKQNSEYNITNVPDFRYIMRQRIKSAADEMSKRLHIIKTGRKENRSDDNNTSNLPFADDDGARNLLVFYDLFVSFFL